MSQPFDSFTPDAECIVFFLDMDSSINTTSGLPLPNTTHLSARSVSCLSDSGAPPIRTTALGTTLPCLSALSNALKLFLLTKLHTYTTSIGLVKETQKGIASSSFLPVNERNLSPQRGAPAVSGQHAMTGAARSPPLRPISAAASHHHTLQQQLPSLYFCLFGLLDEPFELAPITYVNSDGSTVSATDRSTPIDLFETVENYVTYVQQFNTEHSAGINMESIIAVLKGVQGDVQRTLDSTTTTSSTPMFSNGNVVVRGIVLSSRMLDPIGGGVRGGATQANSFLRLHPVGKSFTPRVPLSTTTTATAASGGLHQAAAITISGHGSGGGRYFQEEKKKTNRDASSDHLALRKIFTFLDMLVLSADPAEGSRLLHSTLNLFDPQEKNFVPLSAASGTDSSSVTGGTVLNNNNNRKGGEADIRMMPMVRNVCGGICHSSPLHIGTMLSKLMFFAHHIKEGERSELACLHRWMTTHQRHTFPSSAVSNAAQRAYVVSHPCPYLNTSAAQTHSSSETEVKQDSPKGKQKEKEQKEEIWVRSLQGLIPLPVQREMIAETTLVALNSLDHVTRHRGEAGGGGIGKKEKETERESPAKGETTATSPAPAERRVQGQQSQHLSAVPSSNRSKTPTNQRASPADDMVAEPRAHTDVHFTSSSPPPPQSSSTSTAGTYSKEGQGGAAQQRTATRESGGGKQIPTAGSSRPTPAPTAKAAAATSTTTTTAQGVTVGTVISTVSSTAPSSSTSAMPSRHTTATGPVNTPSSGSPAPAAQPNNNNNNGKGTTTTTTTTPTPTTTAAATCSTYTPSSNNSDTTTCSSKGNVAGGRGDVRCALDIDDPTPPSSSSSAPAPGAHPRDNVVMGTVMMPSTSTSTTASHHPAHVQGGDTQRTTSTTIPTVNTTREVLQRGSVAASANSSGGGGTITSTGAGVSSGTATRGGQNKGKCDEDLLDMR